MKQLTQNLKNGVISLTESPVPQVGRESIVVQSSLSLISTGTERMLLEFGRGSLIEKVKSQPEKVNQVINKIKTDGLMPTLDAVKAKLDDAIVPGYSLVGEVFSVGRNVDGFYSGDRVVCNGGHAEFVRVSKNLAAKIPDNVSDETAVFTVVGAIALQGIRLLNPALGESICVIGLGLVGQLTVQLLTASGCRVFGIDINEDKVKLVESFGAVGFTLQEKESPVDAAMAFSRGMGMDGVIVAASTKSTEPIDYAAEMSKKRGKIVLTGVTGLELKRRTFYDKELTFQVSCSYGPGRYDRAYEELGNDYPFGYVRWTLKRNFEAVLDMMTAGKIDVKPLISRSFPFADADKAYDLLMLENPLGIVLQYDKGAARRDFSIELTSKPVSGRSEKPVIGYIGVGNFAKQVLLPALKNSGAVLKTIASASGGNVSALGQKFGFALATSEYSQVFEDSSINTLFISTRHGSHAELVIRALKSGKNVFVEKPLALNKTELKDVIDAHSNSNGILLVGFNRRFSVFSRKLKESLSSKSDPLCINIMVNAGAIEGSHWVHDTECGGGRIIGEACHFIDLIRYFTGSQITEVYAVSTHGHSVTDSDKMCITIKSKDGSIGTINYFSNGSKSYPKERIEVFSEGRVYVIDNFKSLTCFGKGKSHNQFAQDKGHGREITEFLQAVETGGKSPIPFEELIESTLSSFAAVESSKTGKPLIVEIA
ncbi:bi-domain-containing oxidoreductase [Candidatus Magnetomonas plexicatena]|uniref:bi-domain-containing oxidoreductase n=1 Tax=Candidatus Magnetomonas plexicatena TaxID=2552947 RepID=UPI001C75F2B8|nr:Gfo/Idh/MocA family oxidoreductase [Nitrospirales bacterium LBB_01]